VSNSAYLLKSNDLLYLFRIKMSFSRICDKSH
jgi:hypothetical protein